MTKDKFQKLVLERVASNGGKWVQADSAWMVRQVFLDETGEELGPEPSKAIDEVINFSAFAQKIEKAGLIKREKRNARSDSYFADFIKPASQDGKTPESPIKSQNASEAKGQPEAKKAAPKAS